MAQASTTLAELSSDPFALLQEIERLSSRVAAGRGLEVGVETEWVGIAYQIGDFQFVTRRDEVREILTLPPVRRVPGAKAWIKGLANVRGQLLPIIDSQMFFGGEATMAGRGTRVLWVNSSEIPAGLIVDEVRGFRRFTDEEKTDALQSFDPSYKPFLQGGYQRGEELWNVLALKALIESQVFLQAAE